nr:hypothetical protein [Tanacetum cinerariifolium]
MNQNYFVPNPGYDFNYYGFDQPQQYSIDHQEELNQQQINNAIEDKMKESHNKLLNMVKIFCEHILWQREQAANLSINITEPSLRLNSFSYDDDGDYDYEERTIPLNDIISQIPSSIVITTSPLVLPTKDPEDSLIIGNEELNTIPKKESDEFIKSSVEDLVPVPSESDDTSGSDSEYVLPSCYDFSPIDVPKEKAVLEDIESKNSYDSNLDESTFLVIPLSDVNEDECFDPVGDVDKINDFEDGYYDSEGDILYLESLLSDDTTPNLPPEMESLNPQVVATTKLPILNPNELDLWKMRIEQYFLMTDYSLWEVILNGDSPPPTKIVDGVVQIIAPTTAEQRLAKKNELKARGGNDPG